MPILWKERIGLPGNACASMVVDVTLVTTFFVKRSKPLLCNVALIPCLKCPFHTPVPSASTSLNVEHSHDHALSTSGSPTRVAGTS